MARLGLNEIYAKYERLRDHVGAERLLEEIIQEMSCDQMNSFMEDAYKAFDLEDEDLNPDE